MPSCYEETDMGLGVGGSVCHCNPQKKKELIICKAKENYSKPYRRCVGHTDTIEKRRIKQGCFCYRSQFFLYQHYWMRCERFMKIVGIFLKYFLS